VTIVARNYLPFARTLFASMAAEEPSIDRYVFVVDAGEDVLVLPEAEVLTPTDVFDFESYAGLAYSFDVTELSTCVKPFVLRHLLARGYDRAFYFDPDIEVFMPIDAVRDPLDDADVVLTPHTTDPIPLDGELPEPVRTISVSSASRTVRPRGVSSTGGPRVWSATASATSSPDCSPIRSGSI
jgi:hypothetical protein